MQSDLSVKGACCGLGQGGILVFLWLGSKGVYQSRGSVSQSGDSVSQSRGSVSQSRDSVYQSRGSVHQSRDSAYQSRDSYACIGCS
jgi:hypothetical protein